MERLPDDLDSDGELSAVTLVDELVIGMMESERPWRYLKTDPPALKVILKLDRVLLPGVAVRVLQRGAESDFDARSLRYLNEVAQRIALRRIEWSEYSLAAMARALAAQMDTHGHGPEMTPANALVRIVERQYHDGIPEELAIALDELATSYELRSVRYAAIGAYARKLRSVLRGGGAAEPLSDDRWAQAIAAAVEAAGFPKTVVNDLLRLCVGATAVKVSGRFRDGISDLTRRHGDDIGEIASTCIDASLGVPNDDRFGGIPPATGDILRGLVWTIEQCCRSAANDRLAAVAIYGWTKVRYYGPASTKVGNAAIDALARVGNSLNALAYVASMVRQPVAVERVEAAIRSAATNSELPLWLITERSLPDFGIEVGERRFAIDGFTVTWRVAENGRLKRTIEDAGGKKLRSLPAATLRENEPEVDEMMLWKRQLQQFASVQRLKVERQLCSARERDLDHWLENFAFHGVLGQYVGGLVWEIRSGVAGGWRQVFWSGERFEDHDGKPVPVEFTGGTSIRLWNPATAPEDERTLWRLSEAAKLKQPFKQIDRETYRPMPEESGRTSLKRYSGLTLIQKRLAALCGERGWKFSSIGDWESEFAGPKLHVEESDLSIGLDLDEEATQALRRSSDDHGPWVHLVSRDVRFSRASDDMPLRIEEVDLRIFSEALRDIDLFATVCIKS